ncbi:uncharacterized protein RBU33_002625 isoform 1-T1 [Hipposideros larvatus]
MQDILKVLVSDLNRSNGVVLPPLDEWKPSAPLRTVRSYRLAPIVVQCATGVSNRVAGLSQKWGLPVAQWSLEVLGTGCGDLSGMVPPAPPPRPRVSEETLLARGKQQQIP